MIWRLALCVLAGLLLLDWALYRMAARQDADEVHRELMALLAYLADHREQAAERADNPDS